MAESLFSASWYRVKDLTPRLRAHARIHRHRYRGETWYVLQDPANERFLRFTPAAHFVIGIMNGRRSVDEIWRLGPEALGDDAPTQDELIRLLGQLHAADVLQCDVPPDAMELFERREKRERQQWKSRLLTPFAIRIPLVDPDRFLARTLPFVRPLLGWAGALLWLAVVLPALVLLAVHGSELTENLLDRLMTPQNLLVIWLIFPVLKLFHELGHGYIVKAFGGDVHEMGVMLLVFTPVPYVDASSAWALPSKQRRALVGAGGMLFEIFLAALAFYVWLGAEPGVVRVAAYNALLIGGATTLLFNANPLLRFDGYYILSDWLEIPNLASRANRYVLHLVERDLFGHEDADAPPTAPGEPAWLVGYAVAAFLYRITIVLAILLWILDQFFVIGLVLGAFAVVGWFGLPLFRGLRQLLTGPRLRSARGRALAVCGGALALALGALTLVPVPLRTRAEGVVWIPEEALVRAGTDGFVERVVVEPGARVAPGTLLIETRDLALEAEAATLEARVREIRARHAAQLPRSRAQAEIALDELRYAEQGLARARERTAQQAIRSGASGSFVIPRSEDLPGRFVSKGELLAYVVDRRSITVRAVVPQDDVDLVRERTAGVKVRLAEQLSETHEAVVRRIVPAASERLPSRVLGSGGGGEVPVDPSEPGGELAVRSLFEVELEVPATGLAVNGGGRVYVRFDHGREPLAAQWYRRLRQLFLSRFHV
ncbi:MAG: HlyD family efflux transporter periplasmic adaptor subunit [Myxococcota bacterium]|nr:HlyD family efflux transporter periplasmic adaptor subunit [Myxococcota bacterium]